MSERIVQNAIREALAPHCRLYRGNAGKFRSFDGKRVVEGLPEGFSDLFGFTNNGARFIAIECKEPNWKMSKEGTKKGDKERLQLNFHNAVREAGGIAGFCKSVDDALALLK